jgi:hypothetical protein
MLLPYSLIIGWESPGSALPLSQYKFLKHLEKKSMLSLFSRFQLYFPSLTFHKPQVHTSCYGFFPVGHKDFGSLLTTDCTNTVAFVVRQPDVKG